MPPTRRSTRPAAPRPYSRTNNARSVSPTTPPSTASLSRTHSNGAPALKFTVKASPSKLRQATSGARHGNDPYDDEQMNDAAPTGRSVRSTRNPRTVVEPDSDDDEDIEDADEDLEPELTNEGFDDEDEEDEDMDEEDADAEEDDGFAASHPPPPNIHQTSTAQGKPRVKVSAPDEGALQSVEDKELEDEDNSSDLESDEEGMNTTLGPEDDDELDDEEEEEEDDESDEENSRSATPDLSKLTRRQRGQFEEYENGLLSLSNEPGKKKIITEAEHVMRRQEMARRRKNLSEKRNEEEKQETIDRLLKKPAPKRRTRAEMLAAQLNAGTPAADDEGEEIKPDPVFTRWVSSSRGSRLGVPIEWLQSPIAEALARSDQLEPQAEGRARILIEEVA